MSTITFCTHFVLIFPHIFVALVADTRALMCNGPPNLGERFKLLIHVKRKWAVITCNTEKGYYPDFPAPGTNQVGRIFIEVLHCQSLFWRQYDVDRKYLRLRCSQGCRYPASDAGMHVTSSPENCKLIDHGIGTTRTYFSCEISCMPGYFPLSDESHHLSNLTVYCRESKGHSRWDIPSESGNDPYVKCSEGCFAYGSNYEEVMGLSMSFRTIGTIKGVPRYLSGEIWCDGDNGWFPVSNDYKETILMTCADGTHYEPVMEGFYCQKGCLKPNGSLGGMVIGGYTFGCSHGRNGYYLTCSYACSLSEGYLFMDRMSYEGPRKKYSAEVKCIDGSFDMERAKYKCVKECYIGNPCPKRYNCLVEGAPFGGLEKFAALYESYVSSMMVKLFGDYDFLA